MKFCKWHRTLCCIEGVGWRTGMTHHHHHKKNTQKINCLKMHFYIISTTDILHPAYLKDEKKNKVNS